MVNPYNLSVAPDKATSDRKVAETAGGKTYGPFQDINFTISDVVSIAPPEGPETAQQLIDRYEREAFGGPLLGIGDVGDDVFGDGVERSIDGEVPDPENDVLPNEPGGALGSAIEKEKPVEGGGFKPLDCTKFIGNEKVEHAGQPTPPLYPDELGGAAGAASSYQPYGDEFDAPGGTDYSGLGLVLSSDGTPVRTASGGFVRTRPLSGPAGGPIPSDKPLSPTGMPPGAARAEALTFQDPSTVAKSSRLTQCDKTTIAGPTGQYADQLKAMMCDEEMIYFSEQYIIYSNTTGGGAGSVFDAGNALGAGLNSLAEGQFDAATNLEVQESILNAIGIDDPSSIEGFEFGDSLQATFDNLRASGVNVDGILAATNPLQVANAFLGASENNPQQAGLLAEFFRESVGWNVSGADLTQSQNAWCAAFANSVLSATGLETNTPNVLGAAAFANWGTAVYTPGSGEGSISNIQPGDVAVFKWPTGGNHVGFVQSVQGNTISVLGGNQSDSVKVSNYSLDSLTHVRRASK
jgi:uncharacterized protein (TIGR02594 family)